MHVFSSNFELYSDISHRLKSLLFEFCADVENYSVDEAFLSLTDMKEFQMPNEGERGRKSDEWQVLTQKLSSFASDMCRAIRKQIGVPVSIGISSTKSLAKLATAKVKKLRNENRVWVQLDNEQWCDEFKGMPLTKIWGVGRRMCIKLTRHGILDVHDLVKADIYRLKRSLGVQGVILKRELSGESCIDWNVVEDGKKKRSRKTILSSRTFAKKTNDKDAIIGAVSHHVWKICKKLRQQDSLGAKIGFLVTTGKYSPNGIYDKIQEEFLFEPPSYEPSRIMREFLQVLPRRIKENCFYAKAGAFTSFIVKESREQLFFCGDSKNQTLVNKEIKRNRDLMKKLDRLDDRLGRHSLDKVRLATEMLGGWKTKRQRSSPRYSTDWEELAIVH